MVQILDDEQLESLQCTKCRSYLSVFPIKNHPSRDVTCGRCSRDYDDGVRSTLYELVAEKYLFRCVNRYEGCRKLLRPDETVGHERRCRGEVFVCPKCGDGTYLTVLQLVWHYKSRHHSSYLRKNSFSGRLPVEDVMLYVHGDVVFFVTMRLESSLNVLYLDASTLTEVDATQSFSVRRGAVFERTDRRRCDRVDAFKRERFIVDSPSVEAFEVVFEPEVAKGGPLYDISSPVVAVRETTTTVPIGDPPVRTTSEFEQCSGYTLNDGLTALIDPAGQGYTIVCSNCGLAIGLPVYRCTRSCHKVCHDCRQWCGSCESPVVASSLDDPFCRLVSNLRFRCVWRCGGYYATYLRAHEGACELRAKRCPECPAEVGLGRAEKHLWWSHRSHFVEEYDGDAVTRLIGTAKEGKVYFLSGEKRWCSLEWSYSRPVLCNPQVQLKVTIIESKPNVKIGMVFKDTSCSYRNVMKVHYKDVGYYIPYLCFN